MEANQGKYDCASHKVENIMEVSPNFKTQVLRVLYFWGHAYLLTSRFMGKIIL